VIDRRFPADWQGLLSAAQSGKQQLFEFGDWRRSPKRFRPSC
jgi:hypothetical protein